VEAFAVDCHYPHNPQPEITHRRGHVAAARGLLARGQGVPVLVGELCQPQELHQACVRLCLRYGEGKNFDFGAHFLLETGGLRSADWQKLRIQIELFPFPAGMRERMLRSATNAPEAFIVADAIYVLGGQFR
jgi:hypothetical protein